MSDGFQELVLSFHMVGAESTVTWPACQSGACQEIFQSPPPTWPSQYWDYITGHLYMEGLNSACQAFVASTSTEPLCRPRKTLNVLVIVLPVNVIKREMWSGLLLSLLLNNFMHAVIISMYVCWRIWLSCLCPWDFNRCSISFLHTVFSPSGWI